MRESRTSGSGRGDQGNPVPYRHRNLVVRCRAVERQVSAAVGAIGEFGDITAGMGL